MLLENLSVVNETLKKPIVRFKSSNITGYVPFCNLKQNILWFYQAELNHFKRKTKNGKDTFWHDSYEDYFYREIVEYSLVVLRFTIAAMLGESRHFWRHTYDPLHCENVLKTHYAGCGCKSCNYGRLYEEQGLDRSKALYVNAENYVYHLMGDKRYQDEPVRNRTFIYKSFVPEYLWLRYLVVLRYIFKDALWDGSYGGKKWAKGCEYAIKL